MAASVHPYPTIGEINKKVAGNFFSTKIFSDKVKKGLKFFILIKHPGQERVKTRLCLDLGKTITEELYKNFVFDLLKTLEDINIAKHIYFTPNSAQEQMMLL